MEHNIAQTHELIKLSEWIQKQHGKPLEHTLLGLELRFHKLGDGFMCNNNDVSIIAMAHNWIRGKYFIPDSIHQADIVIRGLLVENEELKNRCNPLLDSVYAAGVKDGMDKQRIVDKERIDYLEARICDLSTQTVITYELGMEAGKKQVIDYFNNKWLGDK